MRKKYKTLCLASAVLVQIFMILPLTYAANYPLSITNIEATGSMNRIRFAYPGLEYSFYVAARGGSYPYTYELAEAPSGLYIDKKTGQVVWSNPLERTTPYSVTVRITDSEGISVSESWSVRVSKNNFFFVDAINGTSRLNGGNGSISNPWKNIEDFYLGEADSTFAGAIIYFRRGTYTLWHEPGTNNNERGQGSDRIPFTSNKPIAYLAYPGENPVMNLECNGNTGKHFWLANANNFFFQGLSFQNIWNYALEIANSKFLTVIDCNFNGLNCATNYSNQAHLAGFGYDSFTNNLVVIGNTFDGAGTGGSWKTGLKAYGYYYSVIERNRITNMDDHGVSIKGSSDYNTIRGNIIRNCNVGIGSAGYEHTNNNEYCFNLIQGSNIPLYFNDSGTIANTYIYNNTTDTSPPRFRILETDDMPFVVYKNIFINNATDSSTFGEEFYRNKCRFQYLASGQEQVIYQNNFIFNNNLMLSDSDGVLDSNGLLTGAYSQYEDSYGWSAVGKNQATDTEKPAAPSGVTIENAIL